MDLRYFVTIVCVVFFLAGSAAASESLHASLGDACEETMSELKVDAVSADFRAFDQVKGAGWRKLYEMGCPTQAALLIEHRIADGGGGPKWLMHFHAGENHAWAGDKERAIQQMTLSLYTDTNSVSRWADYVIGVIAFLREDKKVLKEKIVALEKSSASIDHSNAKVLRKLSRHVGLGYREAKLARD